MSLNVNGSLTTPTSRTELVHPGGGVTASGMATTLDVAHIPSVVAAAGHAYEAANGLPDFALTPEQIEAYELTRTVGWAGFHCQIKALLGSLCSWVVEERQGTDWVRSENPRMQALARVIGPLEGSQTAMRYRSLSLQARIGEHAAWAVNDGDLGLGWDIAHPRQMRRSLYGADRFGVAYRRDARPAQGFGYREFPIARLRRHWVEDDEWPEEARFSIQNALGEARLYHSMVCNMQRGIDSRMLMNGLLYVPTDPNSGDDGGGSWTPTAVDPGDQTPDANSGLAALLREFAKYGARAYRDTRGNDVASRMPFPFPHHSEPKMLDLGRAIDSETIEALAAVVHSGALGLDTPTQYLTVGEASANHWGDAELRRALHERSIWPETEKNDDFWTRIGFQPFLAATRAGRAVLADNDPADYRLASDRSKIELKSGNAEQYMAEYRLGLRDRKSTAEALDLSTADLIELPVDVAEYEHWVYARASAGRAQLEVQRDGLTTLPKADDDPGEPNEVNSAVAAGALELIRGDR